MSIPNYFSSDLMMISFQLGEMGAKALLQSTKNFSTYEIPDKPPARRWFYIPVVAVATVASNLIFTISSIVAAVESVFKGIVNLFGAPLSKELSFSRGVEQITLDPLMDIAFGLIIIPILIPFHLGSELG